MGLPLDNEIKPWGAGTVHISIIDKENNAISCTPSGGWIRSNEVIKDLGFPLGNRLMTFYPKVNFVKTSVERFGLSGLSAHYVNFSEEEYKKAIDSL